MNTGRSLLAVYLAAICVILLLPLGIVLAVSLDPGSNIQFPTSGVSTKWFRAIWSNETMVLALWNSIIVGVSSSVLAGLVSVPAALAIASGSPFARKIIYPMLLAPFAIPWIVYGLAMVFFWGALNLDLSLWTVFAAHTIIAIPYVLRVTLAVLVGMPPALLKAARSAGANPWRAFLHITLPYITPGLIAGISFAFVISFTNIPVSLFITTAQNITLPVAIFNYMVNNFEPVVATASVIQVVVIGLILAATRRLGDGVRT
jgi:putative spermidine/putrescine transport system permease protein